MTNASITLSIALLILYAATPSQSPAPNRQISPFLTLPVKNFVISEGWDYDAELPFHPDIPRHFAVDFRVPRGTPVYAAADGFAVQSFQTFYLDKLDQPGVHEWRKNRRLGFGIGHFIQIWHPEQQVFTSYCHLDRVAGIIPYVPPVEEHPGLFNPTVVYQPLEEVLRVSKPVQRGQLIGYVGDTGLSMDYEEKPELPRNPSLFPSWDLPHLHFEVYTRNAAGRKEFRWDPYGIYGKTPDYASGKPATDGNLWLLDSQGKPK
jgi:murein DD-endopeptidase MepM/ murein hydrolase activator NlpD